MAEAVAAEVVTDVFLAEFAAAELAVAATGESLVAGGLGSLGMEAAAGVGESILAEGAFLEANMAPVAEAASVAETASAALPAVVEAAATTLPTMAPQFGAQTLSMGQGVIPNAINSVAAPAAAAETGGFLSNLTEMQKFQLMQAGGGLLSGVGGGVGAQQAAKTKSESDKEIAALNNKAASERIAETEKARLDADAQRASTNTYTGKPGVRPAANRGRLFDANGRLVYDPNGRLNLGLIANVGRT